MINMIPHTLRECKSLSARLGVSVWLPAKKVKRWGDWLVMPQNKNINILDVWPRFSGGKSAETGQEILDWLKKRLAGLQRAEKATEASQKASREAAYTILAEGKDLEESLIERMTKIARNLANLPKGWDDRWPHLASLLWQRRMIGALLVRTIPRPSPAKALKEAREALEELSGGKS